MAETLYDERPCPSEECGGAVRTFKTVIATSGSGKVVARVTRCTWCGYNPGETTQKTGSVSLAMTSSIDVDGTVVPAPEPAAHRTGQLEELGFTLKWWRLTEGGAWLVQAFDDAGDLIDAGAGDDPVDAILGVAERLLPKTDGFS